MAHNPRHPYDEASDIVDQHFPSLRAANGIMRESFPAAAAADRTLADAGLIPKRGRGGYTGPRTSLGGPGGRAAWSGPHRRDPSRPSKLGRIIAADSLRGQLRGYTVQIQTWAGLMEQNGVTGEVIFSAYEAAGGSPVLSAAQQRGNTSDFLHDFVAALEDLGVDPSIIAGTYQQAGGRIGDVDEPGSGKRGGGGSPFGGFMGGAARVGGDVVGAVTKAGGDAAAEIGRAIRKIF